MYFIVHQFRMQIAKETVYPARAELSKMGMIH